MTSQVVSATCYISLSPVNSLVIAEVRLRIAERRDWGLVMLSVATENPFW